MIDHAPSRLLAACGLLPLLLGAALVACSEPAAEESPCSGAACGAGGSGGGGGAEGCPDHAESSRCHADSPESGCGAEVCTIAATRCPGGERCCTLPLACAAAVGLRAGGIPCDDGDQCESGVCVEVTGVKSCLRPCSAAAGHDSCPQGQHCETVAFAEGATTTTCIGGSAEARDPEGTLCTRPSHCPEGRICKIVHGELTVQGNAFARCVVPPAEDDFFESCAPAPDSGIDVRVHGEVSSGSCDSGGLCWDACRGRASYACICTGEQLDSGSCRAFRCTGVCGTDADCPDRTLCQGTNQVLADPALAFSICRLPEGAPLDWACWDELDCCKDSLRADGGPCCVGERGGCDNPPTPAAVTHCRFTSAGGKYMTQCGLPAGLAALGFPCASHADCESGLCTESGAGRTCAAVCDLRFDRCPDVAPGTVCCATAVDAEDGPHCVPTCSASCGSPPACDP